MNIIVIKKIKIYSLKTQKKNNITQMLMLETQFRATTVEKQLLKHIVTLFKSWRDLESYVSNFTKPRGKMKVIIDI